MPKQDSIKKMFDGIAPSYDRLNHLMSLGVDRRWRRRAVKEVVDGSAQQILDIACGTGDLTVDIAKAAGAGSKVTGSDISEGMMSFVMSKAAHEGVSERIRLKVADGCNLPWEDGSFDRVTCAFGIRNFEDKSKGLKEFCRVIRPGGKMIILELSVPSNKFLLALYKLYFLHVMPWIGGMISGDKAAYRYLPASVMAFPSPETFCGMISAAGFRTVRHRAFTMGLCRMYIGEK